MLEVWKTEVGPYLQLFVSCMRILYSNLRREFLFYMVCVSFIAQLLTMGTINSPIDSRFDISHYLSVCVSADGGLEISEMTENED